MTITILEGDCRALLKTLAAGSVNCTVTSPPYFGLRDYGHDEQIGLEPSPEEFVAALVEVFREVRRVTRDDGLLFVNMGDSYARDAGKGQHKPGDAGKQNYVIERGGGRTASTVNLKSETQGSSDGKVGRHARAANALGGSGLKPKDLIGIPWMLAFALRADGWYLRQDIIWHKPNAMPESVEDRCTKSHEHVFMLSRSERYWYDADAIAELAVSDHKSGNGFKRDARLSYLNADGTARGNEEQWTGVGGTRNRRDVWSIPTEPSAIPHFAMMPTELARLCTLAGCPEGGHVLDPFGGVGTTAMVADRLKRNATMIELNPESIAHMRDRLHGDAGIFAEVK